MYPARVVGGHIRWQNQTIWKSWGGGNPILSVCISLLQQTVAMVQGHLGQGLKGKANPNGTNHQTQPNR